MNYQSQHSGRGTLQPSKSLSFSSISCLERTMCPPSSLPFLHFLLHHPPVIHLLQSHNFYNMTHTKVNTIAKPHELPTFSPLTSLLNGTPPAVVVAVGGLVGVTGLTGVLEVTVPLL